MTDLDRETAATIEAFARCIRNAGPDMGADLLAAELMVIARGRGWRPTEARAPWDYRSQPAGEGVPVSEDALGAVEAARERLREISARLAEGAA